MTPDQLGTVFPPRSAEEIDAYDDAELLAGFMEYRSDDPFPGENRTAAYRWGWQNGHYDHGNDDGYGALRHAAIQMRRRRLS